MKKNENNFAFIDGQNLYMATAKREVDPWKIDLARFRVYLRRKYGVEKAYYFLDFVQKDYQDLYDDYKLLVEFLIEEGRFEKILFLDFARASSLYKKITRRYFDGLDRNGVKEKIAKRKGGLR